MPEILLHTRAATKADRPGLARMLELYQYELSDIWDQDLDSEGAYGYDLARFFDDPQAHAFILTADGHYAGFALVDGAVKVGPRGAWMDQFFVLKKYRRLGAGRVLATAVFAALPGPWEVGQMAENEPAQAFWRRVICQWTAGRFTEHQLSEGWWQGVVQCFQSPAT